MTPARTARPARCGHHRQRGRGPAGRRPARLRRAPARPRGAVRGRGAGDRRGARRRLDGRVRVGPRLGRTATSRRSRRSASSRHVHLGHGAGPLRRSPAASARATSRASAAATCSPSTPASSSRLRAAMRDGVRLRARASAHFPIVGPVPGAARGDDVHARTRFGHGLSRREWRRVGGWPRSSSGCTSLGFVSCSRSSRRTHYSLGSGGVFGVGLGITAYTLGLRHAFDADHIAAIDNTTRKLMADGQAAAERRVLLLARPLDDRVRARAAVRARHSGARRRGRGRRLDAARRDRPDRHRASRARSCYVIAALNLVSSSGSCASSATCAAAASTRPSSRRSSTRAALMNRFYGRFTRAVRKPWQMYPLGILFGLGLRHRDRGRAALPRRRRGGRGPALLRDPLPAGPVRRRDVAARHDRRRRS